MSVQTRRDQIKARDKFFGLLAPLNRQDVIRGVPEARRMVPILAELFNCAQLGAWRVAAEVPLDPSGPISRVVDPWESLEYLPKRIAESLTGRDIQPVLTEDVRDPYKTACRLWEDPAVVKSGGFPEYDLDDRADDKVWEAIGEAQRVSGAGYPTEAFRDIMIRALGCAFRAAELSELLVDANLKYVTRYLDYMSQDELLSTWSGKSKCEWIADLRRELDELAPQLLVLRRILTLTTHGVWLAGMTEQKALVFKVLR